MKKILTIIFIIIIFSAPLVSAFSLEDIPFFRIFAAIGKAIQPVEETACTPGQKCELGCYCSLPAKWIDKAVVVNDLSVNNLRTIPAYQHLALDTIWADAGSWIASEAGNFRVYAGLLDSQGNAIETQQGKLESSYEFKVS